MKKNLFRISALLTMLIFLVSGCEKKDDPKPDPVVVSPGKRIVHFKIVNPAVTAVIDTTARTITVNVPSNTDVTALTTDISLAAGCSIAPASGASQDFTNPVVYTVKGPDNTTTAWTVTVNLPDPVASDVVVVEDITQSVTWTANKTYIINKDITINNSSVLTIEPGTVIKFGASGSLSIGYSSNATIIANGTAEKPIIFTSSALLPAAGAWNGLTFYDKTLSNSSLTYCRILFAGKNSQYGALNLIGSEITMRNCIVDNSAGHGIHVTYQSEKGGFVAYENNAISNTAKYAIVMNAQKISTIGAGNTFTTTKGVYITGDFRSSTAQTWRNLNAPYIITDEVDIDGDLTIEPGTTFRFEANGAIGIGYYDATTFTADGGSAATPITFTSNAATPAAGAWRGVIIYDKTQTNSIMNYCVIEYAGLASSNTAALSFSNEPSITFTNSTIRKSAGYGILLGNDAGFQAFHNNTISDCANHLIVISTKHLPDLGVPNTLTAAANKGIEISGHIKYEDPVTWKKQTADFYVKRECDIDGIITIEPGCRFLFASDGFFWFGYYENTQVTAVGTEDKKIVFTSASASPAPGTWKGLYFDNYVQSNSKLDYCELHYSGQSGKPAIYVETTFTVSNTTISDFSSTHAAEYKTGITAPPGSGNNFTWFAN